MSDITAFRLLVTSIDWLNPAKDHEAIESMLYAEAASDPVLWSIMISEINRQARLAGMAEEN